MTALKFIYNKLMEGVEFGEISQYRDRGTYFWAVLSGDKYFIRWRHAGSSANKSTLRDLKWILSEIFEMTPEEFLFKYTTSSEWYRIDGCYRTKDVR